MAYGLPSRGQRDWDDELNNSMEALRGDTQSAVANASAAISAANNALSVAQSVQGAVIGGADVATAAILATETSASRAQVQAEVGQVSPLTSEAATATTARINAALAATPGVRKVVRLRGAFTIQGALVVPSNTTLDATGATITAGGSHAGCLVRNAGAFPVATGTGSITSGTTTLTTALSLTVGQTVTIAGADGAGATVHTGTVTALGSGNVTIDVAAKTTVAGVVVKAFTRDVDVHVLGGKWVRGSAAAGSNPGGAHNIYLRHLDGYSVDVEGITSTAQKYACSIGSATSGRVTLRGLDVDSDGLHLTGPVRRLTVPLIEGTLGDDAFAITASDWPAYGDTSGDVTDVTVDTINATSLDAGLFKVIAGAGNRVDAITVTGQITGTAANAVLLGDDTAEAATVGGTYGRIDFGTVSATVTNAVVKNRGFAGDLVRGRISSRQAGAMFKLVQWNQPSSGLGSDARTLKRLELDLDVDQSAVTSGSSDALSLAGATQTFGAVVLTGRRVAPALASHLVAHESGTVNEYHIAIEASWPSASGHAVYQVTGTVGRVVIGSGRLTNLNNAYRKESGTGATTTDLVIGAGATIVSCSRVLDARAGTVRVVLDGCAILASTNAALFTNGATLVIDGRMIKVGAWALVQRQAAESVRVQSPQLAVDVSQLARTAGDMAYNSNAGLACGVGVVLCDGTTWKNLYSAATY